MQVTQPRTPDEIASVIVWQSVTALSGARACSRCSKAIPHGASCLLGWRGGVIVWVACSEACRHCGLLIAYGLASAEACTLVAGHEGRCSP